MPQQRPEYEPLDDAKKIATQLVQRYPEKFDGINVNTMRFVQITNKDPKEKKPVWEIRTVEYPIRLDSAFDYYITLYKNDWESRTDIHKGWIVADILHSISRDGDGKVVPMDLKDHGDILRTAGIDWLQKDELPNLLGEVPIQWKTNPGL